MMQFNFNENTKFNPKTLYRFRYDMADENHRKILPNPVFLQQIIKSYLESQGGECYQLVFLTLDGETKKTAFYKSLESLNEKIVESFENPTIKDIVRVNFRKYKDLISVQEK